MYIMQVYYLKSIKKSSIFDVIGNIQQYPPIHLLLDLSLRNPRTIKHPLLRKIPHSFQATSIPQPPPYSQQISSLSLLQYKPKRYREYIYIYITLTNTGEMCLLTWQGVYTCLLCAIHKSKQELKRFSSPNGWEIFQFDIHIYYLIDSLN